MRTPIEMTLLCLALALGGLACRGDLRAYDEAVAADTVEAYQGYLEQFPEGMQAPEARQRLDDLEYEAAEAEGAAAAYEVYLERHPDGSHAKEARALAKQRAWDEAERANTVEAMQAYLERYGSGAARLRAEQRIQALAYAAEHVAIESMEIEGPADGGYVLQARVANEGDRTCETMLVRIAFLDAGSEPLAYHRTYVAAPSDVPVASVPERVRAPLVAGHTRTLAYPFTAEQVPEGWGGGADHLRVEVTEITFGRG